MKQDVQTGKVIVTLENGRSIIGYWREEYNYVFLDCNDEYFFGSLSIDSSKYSASNDALWLLKELITSKGGKIKKDK